MKKRGALALIGAGLAVAAIGLGFQWTTEWRFRESTDDAYLHSDITDTYANEVADVSGAGH